ncbi:hypothetical protein IFM89_016911 [Coptis chinensis]|uniref:Uncharacterized protein n=1 Tax=Coptis chinensis TaxID=261450 RepID=A0A835LVZ0_9MAGN|nr:hypothetical protein IFM89_016911 [Coptis chinensis]
MTFSLFCIMMSSLHCWLVLETHSLRTTEASFAESAYGFLKESSDVKSGQGQSSYEISTCAALSLFTFQLGAQWNASTVSAMPSEADSELDAYRCRPDTEWGLLVFSLEGVQWPSGQALGGRAQGSIPIFYGQNEIKGVRE